MVMTKQSSPADSSPLDMKHLGIITALLSEARCFYRQPLVNEPQKIAGNITLMVSGIGQHAANNAAQKLIAAGADALLSAGMAGSLSDSLKPGDLLVPRTVSTDTGQQFHCDPKWHEYVVSEIAEKLQKPHCGELLSTEKIIATTQNKRDSGKYGAIAVDMESSAILQVAGEHQIPALVIRSIVDPLNYSIPDYVIKNHDQYGEIDTLSLVKSILLAPTQLVNYIKLGRYYRAATNSLRDVSNQLELVLMK